MDGLTRHSPKAPKRSLVVGCGVDYHGTEHHPENWTVDIDSGVRPDVAGDIANLPFRNRSFAKIYLERFPYPELDRNGSELKEIKRTLATHGKLVIQTGLSAPAPAIALNLRNLGFINVHTRKVFTSTWGGWQIDAEKGPARKSS